MSTNGRTPVIVGVGQKTVPPGDHPTYETRPTPLSLMVDSLVIASQDSGAARSLLESLEEIVAIDSFVWRTSDPARLVADALALKNVRTRVTPVGGNIPQKLVHESALRILNGEIDTIAIVGAEAMYASSLARREGRRVDWPSQPPLEIEDEERVPLTAEEYAQGITMPIEGYPLFENARRARKGWSIDHHRHEVGKIWHRFADVAATNPYAWKRDAPSVETIITPSTDNRMVSFPYTKLMVANMPVDMGASFIMTSYDKAKQLGISDDVLVFPQCGADANDHWFISERPVLDDSPAMRALWSSLQSFGVEIDGIAHVDLYSCFPTVVQTACEVLTIDPLDPLRPPTLTGGLTFGGGPGNNYVTHAIASMVDAVRADPSSTGLVSGLGWFSTKHSWGTYATTPPDGGFQWRSAQGEVDAQPVMATTTDDGAVTVETYTVTHERDGSAKRLVVAGQRNGTRVWCHSDDTELAAHCENEDLIGRQGDVQDGIFSLR